MPGYQTSVYRYLKIYSEKKEYRIFDPRKKGQFKPKETGKDIHIKYGDKKLKLGKSAQAPLSQNYNVSINGRIKIENTSRGVYGNGVALWFRNSSNPDELYHPVLGHTEHIHYDILNEQGNFNFNFSFYR